ncbi:MAG: gp53-like domain-containing protein [Betaproteobacteria bacterium]
MDVIQSSNRQIDKFGSGLHGFQAGVPGVSLATALQPGWCDGVQQELINTLRDGGLVPSAATLTQVRDAIRRMYGGNVRSIAAGTTNLTADDAGDVYVDASGGAVTINLPATDAANARPLPLRFFRTDTSANAVTINRAGSNTIFNGASGGTSISLRVSEELHLRGNGAAGASGVWRMVNGAFARSLAANGWQRLPSGLFMQWGTGTLSGGVATVTFPIAFPSTAFANVAIPPTATSSITVTGSSSTSVSFASNASTGGFVWIALGI